MARNPTVYKPHFFFAMATLTPMVVIGGTLYLYYKYGDEEGLRHVPSISEAGADLPASRMFAAGMTVAAWFTMPLYMIINNVMKLKHRIAKIQSNSTIIAMNMLAAFSFFSFMGTASVTIRDNTQLHYTFAVTFLLSQSLFFLMVDLNLRRANSKVPFSHILWTFIAPLAFAITFFFRQTHPKQMPILQYVGSATLFLKWSILWYDMPAAGIMLSKRSN